MKNLIFDTWLDATNCYLAGMGKPRYFRAPCDSLIRDTGADDLKRHEEQCEACKGGWSIWDQPESEECK